MSFAIANRPRHCLDLPTRAGYPRAEFTTLTPMTLLFIYIAIALVFSFLCSIAEAVILSVSTPYIALKEKENHHSGAILRKLKEDINRPLAAILTLNTIAHTIGAAGAGAQAAVVFGSNYVGIISAVLTLLILVFSEIIPKSLGAHYWTTLAPITAYGLKYLTILLYPFVKLSGKLTGNMIQEATLTGFSRDEFVVMAELSEKEGQLAQQESKILRNLMLLRNTTIKDAMTPRTVVFSLPEKLKVEEFFHKYDQTRFSRIPVYLDEPDHVTGLILKDDILLAQARGNSDNPLSHYRRELPVMPEFMPLSQAFEEFLKQRIHLALVVNEYGDVEGVISLEDILETMLGLEIVDEGDKEVDMQKLARSLWRKRARTMGLAPGKAKKE